MNQQDASIIRFENVNKWYASNGYHVLRDINLDFAKQMQPILEGQPSTWTLMRESKKLDAAKDDELRGVLSQQQFDAYLAAKDEMRERVKQKALANAAAQP
jgi:hypothetical protein